MIPSSCYKLKILTVGDQVGAHGESFLFPAYTAMNNIFNKKSYFWNKLSLKSTNLLNRHACSSSSTDSFEDGIHIYIVGVGALFKKFRPSIWSSGSGILENHFLWLSGFSLE